MMRLLSIITCISCFAFCGQAQYPGAAGTAGSTAIHQDSGIIVSWANACESVVGYLDIANKSLGSPYNGNDSSCIGFPSLNVLSLGDSGYATLTFEAPIYNGEGFDFVVFENSFSDFFLELAFIEVSSDGQTFVRFPSAFVGQDTLQQGPYDETSDPTKIHNLAGKYRGQFGTPFDLEELVDSTNINLDRITHVRVVDVVGTIHPNHAQKDAMGNSINDPYPTDFDFGGFDLNAIGAINQHPLNINEQSIEHFSMINPLPTGSKLQVNKNGYSIVSIVSLAGCNFVIPQKLDYVSLPDQSGIYTLVLEKNGQYFSKKVVLLD